MKKKIYFGIIAAIFILAAILAQAKIVPDGARLDVTLISQEPDPAEPGEIMDVRFKVENIGGSAAEDILFEFVEEYPFSVYSGKVQQEIGSLQGQQKAEEGIIVLYKIKVDEAAVEKTYYVDIRYQSADDRGWTTIKDFPLRLRTRDLVVSVESIESEPELVAPGNEFDLSVTVRNNADSIIRDVTAKLDLSDDSIPFAPSNSISEKQIYQINSKTGKILKFNLIALPDADGGVYKVPINISYTDGTGTSYSKNDIISLKISSTPDLLVTIDSSEITEKMKSGIVVFRIVNKGLTDIKLVTTELESGDYYTITEPSVYVGNIDSDDYETVDYEVIIKGYEKMVELPLKLEYRDATNKMHKQTVELELKTHSKGLVLTIISKIFSTLITLGIIGGIFLGIRWLWRKRKTKRKG